MGSDVDETPPLAAPTTTSTSAHDPVKTLRRACDCCRRRKVRCDSADPCGPCKKALIRCAYLQPPRKKGPKGLRSARVLHALRRIDDTTYEVARPQEGLEQHGTFGNWGWSSQTSSSDGPPHPGEIPPGHMDTSQSSATQNRNHYLQAMANATPSSDASYRPALYTHDSSEHGWPLQSPPLLTAPAIPIIYTPTTSELPLQRITADIFLPYVQLFFEHMFPIMPIVDRSIYLDPALYTDVTAFSPDMYCFLCALCAATSIQLDTSISQPPPFHPTKANNDGFAEECLRERKTYDYIEDPTTLSVMCSFFLFAFHGNHEKHVKAWHYLQESITFAESLALDDEASYSKLDASEAQWRRRLYWLLFVTERAYAVQRRRNVRLHASVRLPAVFESEDPLLLNGFVNLASLFSAVDDSFVSAWRGSRRQSLCNEAWLAATQKSLDTVALALDNVSETQHLDISVTREWLHVLAWQMGVSNGLIWGRGEGGMGLDYPIELARRVVQSTSGANALALDSHGIGMEQKLADITGCLADVLRCTVGDTSPTFLQGKEYLNILLQRLSSIRGKESRYLQPLLSKLDGLMGYELHNQTLPLPPETLASFLAFSQDFLAPGHRFSIADSVGMLRTLSMSGNLGMPASTIPHEDWQQRRPSGRVYDENETRAMDVWFMSNGASQVV